jgi:hypothetical protein
MSENTAPSLLPTLPELPETADEAHAKKAVLVIFRFDADKVYLDGEYALEDAQEWCERDDTHGDGWFAAYYNSKEH